MAAIEQPERPHRFRQLFVALIRMAQFSASSFLVRSPALPQIADTEGIGSQRRAELSCPPLSDFAADCRPMEASAVNGANDGLRVLKLRETAIPRHRRSVALQPDGYTDTVEGTASSVPDSFIFVWSALP